MNKWVRAFRYFNDKFNYLDENPNFYKIFEEEAIRAGLQVKSPKTRNFEQRGFKTATIGFYKDGRKLRDKRRRRIPEDIKVDNMESPMLKRFSYAPKTQTPISAPQSKIKKHQTNMFGFKSQEHENFLPKVEGNNANTKKKFTGQKFPVLNTARANPDHLAFETISERTDKIKRTIKRKNSRFSKTGDDEFDKKAYHKSFYGDSKNNDDVTSSYHKKGLSTKQTGLSKQSTKQINVTCK